MARIVVTGASGFVAGSVLHFGSEQHEIHALTRSGPVANVPNVIWHTLAEANPAQINTCLSDIRPDAIIHCAAIANIDHCENNQDEAHAANVELTRILAEACNRQQARMVFVSTDNVYDGKSSPVRASDPTEPVNIYGATKVEAESVVRETLGNAVVARLALVMGFPIIGGGNSFLMRMIEQWEKGESVGVPDNEIRSPIDVVTAGRALIELATHDFCGTLLLGGVEGLNRIDLVRQVAGHFGYSSELVHPFDPTQLPGRADRPLSVIFDMGETRAILDTPIVDVAAACELVKPFRTI